MLNIIDPYHLIAINLRKQFFFHDRERLLNINKVKIFRKSTNILKWITLLHQ